MEMQDTITEQPMMSEEDAVNVLNNMTPEQIRKLMRSIGKRPWHSKHNYARSLRAKARIAKRKGKWK